MRDISIVIPTYNVSRTLRTACRQILHEVPDAELIIVDDNSPDGTGHIADEIATERSTVKVVHRPRKLGVGSAVYDGVQLAESEVVIVMDADLHHPVSVLPKMKKMLENGYDLVIASRYAKGSQFTCSSMLRLVVNKLGNKLAGKLLRLPVQDCTTGFRGYRKKSFLQSFEKSYVDGSFNLVVLANARKQGFRIVEIPCSSAHMGKSNAGFAFGYLRTMLTIAFGGHQNDSSHHFR